MIRLRSLNLSYLIVLQAALLAVWTLGADYPTTEELKSWAEFCDSTIYVRAQLKESTAGDRLEVLRSCSNSVQHNSRLNAALLLDISKPKEVEILQALLNDTAPAIRCIAARSLFGSSANSDEFAARYKYECVLAAEKQAVEIFGGLSKMSPPEQFAATRRLEKLGLDAIQVLSKESENPDPYIALSACVALRCPLKNINPRWFDQLKGKMKKPITVLFQDAPLIECVRFISVLTDAKITIEKHDPGPLINLRVKDLPAEETLRWVCRLADREIDFSDGEVVVSRTSNIACGSEPIWLYDARDLVSAEDIRDLAAVIENLAQNGFVRIRNWNGILVAESLPIGMSGIHLNPDFDEIRKRKLDR